MRNGRMAAASNGKQPAFDALIVIAGTIPLSLMILAAEKLYGSAQLLSGGGPKDATGDNFAFLLGPVGVHRLFEHCAIRRREDDVRQSRRQLVDKTLSGFRWRPNGSRTDRLLRPIPSSETAHDNEYNRDGGQHESRRCRCVECHNRHGINASRRRAAEQQVSGAARCCLQVSEVSLCRVAQYFGKQTERIPI